jgi:hypothetical protein
VEARDRWRQTYRMDWAEIAIAAIILAVAIAGTVIVTRIGIRVDRRPRKRERIRRAKGDYQPPEPPEGRYWG